MDYLEPRLRDSLLPHWTGKGGACSHMFPYSVVIFQSLKTFQVFDTRQCLSDRVLDVMQARSSLFPWRWLINAIWLTARNPGLRFLPYFNKLIKCDKSSMLPQGVKRGLELCNCSQTSHYPQCLPFWST